MSIVDSPHAVSARRWRGRRTAQLERRSWQRPVVALASIAGVVVAWDLAVRILHTEAYTLPAPAAVWEALVRDRAELVDASVSTGKVIAAAFVLSAVIGLVLGTLVTFSRWFERAVYPTIVVSQIVPKIALIPLIIVWFGFGSTSRIIVSVLVCFFPVVINTVTGLKETTRESIQLIESMGGSRLDVLRRVQIPQALPNILTGLKTSATLVVVGAIAAEFVASADGLGYFIVLAASNFDTPSLFAGIAVISLLGVVVYYLVELAERLLIPWHVSRRQQ